MGAGDNVTASAWVRSQSSWVSGSKALMRLSFLDVARNILATKDSAAITNASSGWQCLSVQTDAAPSGTAYVRFRLYLEKPIGADGQSIANFDDCALDKSAAFLPVLSVYPPVLGFGNDLTTLTFDITNTGTGTLTWNITKNVDWVSVAPTNGTTTTETDTITVTANRSGLALPNYSGLITVHSQGNNRNISVFLETSPGNSVPTAPAIVTAKGYRLMVQRRLWDGTLDTARPYIIKGAAWAPASIGTTDAYFTRRTAFGEWYRLDIELLREMNANTVYLFLDPGRTRRRL